MMAEHPELSAQERAGRAFPVSWDQFHRDCRALTWRLNEVGPFHAVIAITRGGLVPAAIVARELGVRVIDTVCIASYDHTKQGDLKVLKGVSADTAKLGGGTGKGLLIVDDLVDTGKTGAPGARHDAGRAFRRRLRQAEGPAAGRYFHHRSVAGHLDLLSLGYRAVVPAADPRRGVISYLSRLRSQSGAREQERTMPLQNRVTPSGDIIATPHRGLFTGNRGIIHDPATKTLTRRWASQAWLTCVCEFRGRRRKVMGGRSWTELFFLDEATALAAGHRPCFYCRRDDANRFRAAWEAGNGVAGVLAREIDAVLHRERLDGGAKRLHPLPMPLEKLPDGAMVSQGNESFLIVQGQAHAVVAGRLSPCAERASRARCC